MENLQGIIIVSQRVVGESGSVSMELVGQWKHNKLTNRFSQVIHAEVYMYVFVVHVHCIYM